ncbi:MAG: shikimate dehydrogenase [Desulfovibrio sp.]
MNQYGIIGHPLGHTLSPVLHNWGFAQIGLDARYDAWDTPSEDLARFVGRMREDKILGLSVTIPHKQAIMPLLDRVSSKARAVGAVNTLLWDRGLLKGTNTDVTGCLVPLQQLGRTFRTGLVLGAGGAARAAVAALNGLGVEWVGVTNRSREKADALAREFGVHVVEWGERHKNPPDVLVNCTPLGMTGHLEAENPWPLNSLPTGTVVFDLVYNPLKTRLLLAAKQSGCTTVSGLEMFLHQGLKQFKLWTGAELDADAARAVLLQRLGTA